MEWKQLMERPNRNSSLRDAVRLHCQGKSTTRLKANLERLFDTLSGDELVDQVIKWVYIYAVKESDKIMDSDSRDVASFNEIVDKQPVVLRRRTRLINTCHHPTAAIDDESNEKCPEQHTVLGVE